MKDWFSAAELAALALPGMPTTRQGVQALAEQSGWDKSALEGTGWRARQGRGGGVEYRLAVLPTAAQAALMLRERGADAAPARADRDARWSWFERLPEKKQAIARQRLDALVSVEDLVLHNVGRVAAMQEVARLKKVRLSTLYGWRKLVDLVPRHDWLAHLAPHHAGRTGARVECADEAWEIIKADFLRPEKPTFQACYRRLATVAAERGWKLPAARTLERRLKLLPAAVKVLAREGTRALQAMMPAQQRERAGLAAMEVVNADGHKWDVFVKWPDGTVTRPIMLAFQDIYSGKILSWRVDRSENRETFRLCFGDMIEQFGIPAHCVLDNSRTFASKWMTGGATNRFRFKVRDTDPRGVMVEMGVQVHFAQPYHGQSKPIERAFRDLAGDAAKHPRFAGAYVGNKPDAKPENYGSAAVPLDVFIETIGQEIIAHNARPGRTGGVALGRSFDQVFLESYAVAQPAKPTAHQRRMFLMTAERVTVNRLDGSITLMGNRFFSPFLHEHRGQKVTVRFDPEVLQQPLHVYRADNFYLGAADLIEAEGFLDAGAARRHSQALKARMRGVQMQLDAERSLSIRDVAAALPAIEPPSPPEAKVVRLVAGNTALKARPAEHPNEQSDQELALIRAMRRLSEARNADAGD